MKRIVRHLPIQVYHSGEAISHSGIVQLLKSPEHYLQYKMGSVEPTPAMEFGLAFHSFVLEPEAFSKDYVLAPKFDRRTKEGKETAAKWDVEKCGQDTLDRRADGHACRNEGERFQSCGRSQNA